MFFYSPMIAFLRDKCYGCFCCDSLKAMEEQRVCQAKIVEALEAEKRKISKELEEMQKRRALREKQTPRSGELEPLPAGQEKVLQLRIS